MSTWVDVNYEYDSPSKVHQVVFEFRTETEAKEFLRLAQIDKDVDDELLMYGQGVIRTITKKRSKDGKRKKVRNL